jgi:hypothetical protein
MWPYAMPPNLLSALIKESIRGGFVATFLVLVVVLSNWHIEVHNIDIRCVDCTEVDVRLCSGN